MALGAVVASGLFPILYLGNPQLAAASPGDEATSQISMALLASTPSAAAASDASAAEYASIRATIETSDESLAYTSATEALTTCQNDLADLRVRVWRRGGSSPEMESLADCRLNTTTTMETRNQALAALRQVAEAALIAVSSESDTTLAMRIQANLGRNVPIEALCLDLSPDQWSALEAALAKRASGATLTNEEQAVAAIYDSSPDVALVASRLAASQAEYDLYIASLAAELTSGE